MTLVVQIWKTVHCTASGQCHTMHIEVEPRLDVEHRHEVDPRLEVEHRHEVDPRHFVCLVVFVVVVVME